MAKKTSYSDKSQGTLFHPEEIVKHDSPWRKPTSFPDLSSAKLVSIDVETHDEDLRVKGPGTFRGSYIVGLAVGTDDGYRGYFPIRHLLGGNLDPGAVLRWANDQLSNKSQPKVGANLIYDVEFLRHEGVNVQGPLFDVQVAEPLLDENLMSYSLDSLAKRYLEGEGKVADSLYRWLAQAYGGKATAAGQGGNIYRAPVALVGPYAEADVDLPLRIFMKQKELLEAQNLWDLFMMESDLIPMLLEMRRQGVRVDVSKTEQYRDETLGKIKQINKEIFSMTGVPVAVWEAESVAKAFKRMGFDCPTLANGKPTITVDWLERHESPLAMMIRESRKLDKFVTTFLEGCILNFEINGRIHTQFNQLKSDDSGTISGRFSSCNPNLQFIPGRDKVLTPMIRGLFLPEDDEDWEKADYSQVEFRIIVHYGRGESADLARSAYKIDPETDYHSFVARMCNIERKPAKTINFGLAYNMGIDTLAEKLGVSIDRAKELFTKYHGHLPFVRDLQNDVTNIAKTRGYIRTILMRRARFDSWEPADWELSRTVKPTTREKALANWGRIRRARTHTAFNRLIQGSAADVMKMAMVKIWKSGICDYIRAPRLTVHDELDWSVGKSYKQREAFRESVNIMENAVKMTVPLMVETESGPDWGHVKKYQITDGR